MATNMIMSIDIITTMITRSMNIITTMITRITDITTIMTTGITIITMTMRGIIMQTMCLRAGDVRRSILIHRIRTAVS